MQNARFRFCRTEAFLCPLQFHLDIKFHALPGLTAVTVQTFFLHQLFWIEKRNGPGGPRRAPSRRPSAVAQAEEVEGIGGKGSRGGVPVAAASSGAARGVRGGASRRGSPALSLGGG